MHTASLAVAIALALAGGPEHIAARGDLRLVEAWAAPARAGADAPLYIHFDNGSDQSLVVERTTSALSARVIGRDLATEGPERSVHSSGFVIPARTKLRMRPNGPHLTLTAVSRDLRAGDEVPVVLHCPDGLSITVLVVVRAPRA